MQKITPFLWFEKNMDEVIGYYTGIFPNVTVKGAAEIDNTPSGKVQTRSMVIYGTQLDLMTAGPYLPFNPTISFIINCETPEEADELWQKIIAEGKALMPLDSYDFAKKFGWAEDKYGVSWQVLCMEGPGVPEKLVPTLMFCGEVAGRAEEAVNFYTSIFKNSRLDYISKYDGTEPERDEPKATTKHAGFILDGSRFSALDSGKASLLTFKQAVSFVVNCADQAEIDYFWEKLTEGGEEVQCGWLNDKFGVPWQIVPNRMTEMLSEGTPEQIARVTEAFMKMKKFDLATLEEAYKG